MPKIIEGARDKILQNARKRLFEEGYTHLSLREVAKESGIATGTIYNYFASKDYLIASIMMEDWQVALEKMDALAENASHPVEGIIGICEAIKQFRNIYTEIWSQPSVAASATSQRFDGHKILCEQIAERVEILLKRLGDEKGLAFSKLVTEMILSASGNEEVRRQFEEAIKVLCG